MIEEIMRLYNMLSIEERAIVWELIRIDLKGDVDDN